MSTTSPAEDPVAIGNRLVSALERQAWEELAACLDGAVAFRALIPGGLRAADGRAAAAQYLQKWFGDADRLVLLASAVDRADDLLHIAYRFRAHEDRWYIVEQHAYCAVSNGLIRKMDLLCSGFRPEIPNSVELE